MTMLNGKPLLKFVACHRTAGAAFKKQRGVRKIVNGPLYGCYSNERGRGFSVGRDFVLEFKRVVRIDLGATP